MEGTAAFRQLTGHRPWVWSTLRWTSHVIFASLFKIRVHGVRHLPLKQACLVLPKHQRWEDIPLLGLSAPRALHYVAKYELFTHPAARRMLRTLGGIPLNRQRPMESRQSIRQVVDLLRAGEGVVVFTEGTYFPNRMGPGHGGLLRFILNRITAPLIPVGIRYAPKGFPRTVHMRFGAPINTNGHADVPVLLRCAMQDIAKLSELPPN